MGFPERPHDQAQSGTEVPRTGQAGAGQAGVGQAGMNQPGVSQGPGGYGPPAGYSYGPPLGRTNGLSIAALVCGLVQFLLWFFLLVPGFIAAVLALSFGLGGLAQIRSRGEGGRGMAIAGIVLGILGLLGGIAWAILLGVGSTHYHYHTGA
jgi:Domain of unknown function (DUF4190)